MIYNIPETKPIMEPQKTPSAARMQETTETPVIETVRESTEKYNIDEILENLKRLEYAEFPVADVDAEKVKNLLGNLYMELLFPHNDKESFMDMMPGKTTSIFDKKI